MAKAERQDWSCAGPKPLIARPFALNSRITWPDLLNKSINRRLKYLVAMLPTWLNCDDGLHTQQLAKIYIGCHLFFSNSRGLFRRCVITRLVTNRSFHGRVTRFVTFPSSWLLFVLFLKMPCRRYFPPITTFLFPLCKRACFINATFRPWAPPGPVAACPFRH